MYPHPNASSRQAPREEDDDEGFYDPLEESDALDDDFGFDDDDSLSTDSGDDAFDERFDDEDDGEPFAAPDDEPDDPF